MAVAVGGAGEASRRQACRIDEDAQFLRQLTRKGALGQLPLLHLSTWKFPKPSHGPPGRALLKQHPAIGGDQRRRDHEQCRTFFHRNAKRLQFIKNDPLICMIRGNEAASHWGVGMRRISEIFKDRRAATAVEYGLILSLIFLAMVAAVRGVASTTTDMWNNVSNAVSDR